MSAVHGTVSRKFLLIIRAVILSFCLLKSSESYVPAHGMHRNYHRNYKAIKCDQSEIKRILNLNDLKEFHVKFCNLSKIENGYFLPSRSLSVLEIQYSNLMQIESKSLNGLRNLKAISLSHNLIEEVTSWSTNGTMNALITLDLSHNQIREIRVGSFQHYSNLQFLNLEENRLAYLNVNVFASLTFLRHLNLGGNQLKALNGNQFNGMHRLTELLLHSNEIANISADAFKTNEHLRFLHLQDNKLKSMEFLKHTTRQLVHLNLSFNHFLDIAPQAIYGEHKEIINLDMSHNLLVDLANESLYGLQSLEHLNLSYNFLDSLTSIHLRDLAVLLDINLSHNKLKDLPSDLFSHVQHLHSIDLSANRLLKIHENLFGVMPYLSVINLSENQLDDVEFLTNLAPELRRDELALDLRNNHFGMSLNFSALEEFSAVQLAGNDWPCAWLINEGNRLTYSSTLHFGYNYSAMSAWNMEIVNFSIVECFEENNKRSIIMLHTSLHNCSSQTSTKCKVSMDNASPPTLVWPKIRGDKFDSRSVILWMLTAIAIAFGALRVARQIIDRKEHQRLSKQWREKKVNQHGIELEALGGGTQQQKHITFAEDPQVIEATKQ